MVYGSSVELQVILELKPQSQVHVLPEINVRHTLMRAGSYIIAEQMGCSHGFVQM